VIGCHERRQTSTAPASALPPAVVQAPSQREAEGEGESEEAETGECGSERWAVKVGHDGAAKSVAMAHRQPTTIDMLRALSPPEHVKKSPRTSPTETTVFRLDGVRLRWYMREADGDYHMVLADEHGDTMIAEIPAPDCIRRDSPWRDLIARARMVVEAQLHVARKRRAADETVTLFGVGFFDVIHGQRGVAPNGIELHPVLGICFGAGCVP
jgi:hypothetical protein